MRTIITYSEVNAELETTYSPNYRCACKKNAIDGGGKNIYGTDAQFPQNRLIWDVEKDITYYTVTWVFNDGVTPDKVETNVPQGTSVDSATAGKPATDPTRADYDFAGWYIGNDLLDDQTVSGNTTVTAHWTPVTPSTYTVTWNPNNGQWPDNTTTNRQRQVNAGTLISSLSQDVPNYNNVQPGWQFDKWTYADGTDIPAGATVNSNTTLLAHYVQINYTVTFKKDDNSTLYTDDTINYPSGTHTYHYGDVIIIPNPQPSSPVSPVSGKIYEFSNWSLVENGVVTDKKLGTHIVVVSGNHIFAATFNSDDPVDGNIKIFDNIGQIKVIGKSTAPTYQDTTPGNIYNFWDDTQDGWYSGPLDGHGPDTISGYENADVNGKDGGISPIDADRKNNSYIPGAQDRDQLTIAGDGTYYSYVGDSIIYEGCTITDNNYIGQNPQQSIQIKPIGDSVSASDLIDEITFLDDHGNITLHIKSLDSWIKFVVKKSVNNTTDTSFIDMEAYRHGTTTSVYVQGVSIQGEIIYFIKDNNNPSARCGKVEVWTPNGGDCSWVLQPQGTPFTNDNNKYMTHGFVYVYQLGTNFTQNINP